MSLGTVVADGDQALAETTATELQEWIWNRRDDWYAPLVTVHEALEAGESIGKYPIILADHTDISESQTRRLEDDGSMGA